MQMNGIGSSHSDMHQVTDCIQNHQHRMDSKIGMAASAAPAAEQQVNSVDSQTTNSFSLSAWLKNGFSDAKHWLGKIWGNNSSGSVGNEVNVQSGTLHTSQIATAASVVHPAQNVNNNPYFSTVTDNKTSQQNLWEKIKVRFQNITGFLTKRFSFAGSSAFQAKQEQHKEDLRRHSRYREDDLEMDCIITDDSYLMDSYNKKGEYSKLSADK
ncbi:MAG: hypothetical protein E7291_07520 [Lachnospiraceae bacterium]|nr:hypothetical protein [Lachnospiraceae bacterium]